LSVKFQYIFVVEITFWYSLCLNRISHWEFQPIFIIGIRILAQFHTFFEVKFLTSYCERFFLQKLYSMYGQEEGRDGLPGFPYIGAPFIGDYQEDKEEENMEEYDVPVDDDEVRGTQV